MIPSSGVIVVSDRLSNLIRLVTPRGDVTTLAGSGSRGFADGTGTAASFRNPLHAAVIPSTGAIVLADQENHRIRIVTLPAVLMTCDATWHHVALTYSPLFSPYQLSAFLDGALAFQLAAAITLPARAASTLRVGWSGDLTANAGSLFAGSLAELRVYNRALSTTEVVALSQPPLAAFANTAVTPSLPTAGATSYAFVCTAHFTGPSATLARSSASGAWEWAGGIMPSCSPVPTQSATSSATTSATASATAVGTSTTTASATASATASGTSTS